MQRHDQNVIPSPVTAKGMVYVMSGMGGNTISCVNAGTSEVNYSNQRLKGFGSLIYASPVIVDSELYLRGDKCLYCVTEK